MAGAPDTAPSGAGHGGFWARRRAGVLLHPTSLPGGAGNGDLGEDAHRFVDWLAEAGFGVWQTLPLGPTHGDRSPYQCTSVHAGNPLLINLEDLLQRGWLDRLPNEDDPERRRRAALAAAFQGFQRAAGDEQREAHQRFIEAESHWLEDFALYQALREEHEGRNWLDWSPPLRDRDEEALGHARARLSGAIARVRFEQWLFFDQWTRLETHCHERGVLLFGDLPIFVAHDSAEVWARRELFTLDSTGRQEVVAGVPPDYFSETGQRWGNPLYHWDRMAQEGYQWWIDRLHTQLELFDLVRIDHFRGFVAYWEIPAEAETAVDGHWVPGPGRELFDRLDAALGQLPLVAEDLGLITPDVEALRDELALPGMKILQFAFDGSGGNPYLPHNHPPLSVVYTGTHDNDTTLGWWESLGEDEQGRIREYLGHPGEPMPWPLIRSALASVARLAVIPWQDLLGLGPEHRMNQPGEPDGNWSWRFDWSMLDEGLAGRLRALNGLYGRLEEGD